MIGIHINDKARPYTDMILFGTKKIETRNKPTLDRFVGQRVGIIRTGRGKATLVGYATITDRIEWTSEKDFRQDWRGHRVNAGDKYGSFKGKKFGYTLSDIRRLDNPVTLSRSTYNGNRTYRIIREEGEAE